jgi:esterase/lipase superfamily enzyme
VVSLSMRREAHSARHTTSSTDVDFLYIIDRGAETDPESMLPYGQGRATSMAFGSARVKSRLAERTRDLELSLGQVTELGRFPDEPYAVVFRADGDLYRAKADLKEHDREKRLLREELTRRLARSPSKEITLYVHGFNETFATSAFTTAELCHFLGREPVCTFFTWPTGSTGNFPTSYTSTTESAQYAEDQLKKIIFKTNPRVISDVIQLLRYGKRPGEPGRELVQVGPIVWKFPKIGN